MKLLSSLVQIIPSKSGEPLFIDFSIKCEKELLTLVASDWTISMKIEQKLQDEKGNQVIFNIEEGYILTPTKILFEVIGKFEGETVTLALVDANYLHISDGNSEFKVVVKPDEEYPDINLSVENNNQSLKISIEDFKKLYDITSFAVAIKGSRELFYGINLNYSNNKLSFLATDSVCLNTLFLLKGVKILISHV